MILPEDVRSFSTTWTILPKDTNYLGQMVFGGAFFSQMDLAAASCIRRALQYSDCDSAVTHKWEGEFFKPSYSGDLIFLEAKIVELRHKAIVVEVKCFKEPHPTKELTATNLKLPISSGSFVFVSRLGEEYKNHNLSLS